MCTALMAAISVGGGGLSWYLLRSPHVDPLVAEQNLRTPRYFAKIGETGDVIYIDGPLHGGKYWSTAHIYVGRPGRLNRVTVKASREDLNSGVELATDIGKIVIPGRINHGDAYIIYRGEQSKLVEEKQGSELDSLPLEYILRDELLSQTRRALPPQRAN